MICRHVHRMELLIMWAELCTEGAYLVDSFTVVIKQFQLVRHRRAYECSFSFTVVIIQFQSV